LRNCPAGIDLYPASTERMEAQKQNGSPYDSDGNPYVSFLHARFASRSKGKSSSS
jgi:hypothetical protein